MSRPLLLCCPRCGRITGATAWDKPVETCGHSPLWPLLSVRIDRMERREDEIARKRVTTKGSHR